MVIGDEGRAVAIQRQELTTRLAAQPDSTRKIPDDVDVPPAQRLRLRLWQWPGGGNCDWYDDESTLESQLWQVIVHMEKVTKDICHAVAMMDGGRSPEERQRHEFRREWKAAMAYVRERVLTQDRLQGVAAGIDAWQRAAEHMSVRRQTHLRGPSWPDAPMAARSPGPAHGSIGRPASTA